MSGRAHELLKDIGEIVGAEAARRIAEACAGRKVFFGPRALARDEHPLRTVLGPTAAADLVGALAARKRNLRPVAFPPAFESAAKAGHRQRADCVRALILDGGATNEIARAAQVHPRTVENHRARMRAEGLLSGGDRRG